MIDYELTYPYQSPPAAGTTMEVAEGIRWLQMPLPMSLNHINLYLLEGDTGWTIVDTGIRGAETRDLWEDIFAKELRGKPVEQIICTHMHPDHTGQAGYLYERWQAHLLMSYGEYYQARVMGTMMRDSGNWQMQEYYLRHGLTEQFLDELRQARSNFTPEPEDTPFPTSYHRLRDGDVLTIGRNEWQVMVGTGHSPEHVCLYCKEQRVLISGDQILPIITSNVSVHPTEPDANPLVGWLESHERFKAELPNDILVLPAHNLPFYGVQERLQDLIDHHEDRMLIIEESCVEPQIAIDLLPQLFARELEGHTKVMALGECVAHIHCLMTRGRIERTLENGLYHFRSVDPTLTQRARPGQHEPKDDGPNMV